MYKLRTITSIESHAISFQGSYSLTFQTRINYQVSRIINTRPQMNHIHFTSQLIFILQKIISEQNHLLVIYPHSMITIPGAPVPPVPHEFDALYPPAPPPAPYPCPPQPHAPSADPRPPEGPSPLTRIPPPPPPQ